MKRLVFVRLLALPWIAQFVPAQWRTGMRLDILRDDIYRATHDFALVYNALLEKLDADLRNQVVDPRVLPKRKELERIWKNLWTKIEEWERGW